MSDTISSRETDKLKLTKCVECGPIITENVVQDFVKYLQNNLISNKLKFTWFLLNLSSLRG